MKIFPSLSIVFFLLLFSIASYGCFKNDYANPDYVKEVKDFRKGRVKFLKSEEGYLNLVGLFWLNNGKNTFGSDNNNDLHFPQEFPKKFGTVTRLENKLSFTFEEPVSFNNDSIITSSTIEIDDKSNFFSYGPFRWFIINSSDNYAIRMRNLESPILKENLNLRFYEIDRSWKIIGKFTPYDDYKTSIITNVRNHDYKQKMSGIINFRKDGKAFSLEPNYTKYGMQVMFTDQTTGSETFSGGRFLLLKIPDDNQEVILDFNKALNFPCAVNDYTTCPIPPKTNHIDLMVSAGEKVYIKTDRLVN